MAKVNQLTGFTNSTGSFDSGSVFNSDNTVIDVKTDNVSNPPSEAELIAAYGTAATVGAGYTICINDAGASSNFYQIVSDGTKYWVFTGTVAS